MEEWYKMTIQTCYPTGDGTIQRTGSQGFYTGYGESTEYRDGPPYWSFIEETTSDDSGTWIAWAVTNDSEGCALSFTVPAFVGGSNTIIDYIDVYFRGYPGQSGGSFVTPSGDGNIFNIGLYYNGIEHVVSKTFIDTTGWTTFSNRFTTNQAGNPWTLSDFPIQPMFSYGRYWFTAEKGHIINDNAQNLTSQIYCSISYTIGTTSPAAVGLLGI